MSQPYDDPMWTMALDHLEEEYPQRLARLLKRNQLQEYLDNLIEKIWDRLIKLRKRKGPGFQESLAREQLAQDLILTQNPNRDREKPLLPSDLKRLQRFRDQINQQAETSATT